MLQYLHGGHILGLDPLGGQIVAPPQEVEVLDIEAVDRDALVLDHLVVLDGDAR